MYLAADDARSDVILAGAMVVFGDILLGLVLSAPGIPDRGLGLGLLDVAGAFVVSGLVPLLLARYRDDVPGAFALGGGMAPATTAALLAAPAVLFGILRGFLATGDPVAALLGRVGGAIVGLPVVGATGIDVAGTVLTTLQIVVFSIGTVLLIGFLTVRGRDAWRSDDRSATELLRTLGLGAGAVALLLGTVRALAAGGGFLAGFLDVTINVITLAVIVLVADRAIPAQATVERQAVLTPVVLVAIAHVLATGGLFGGGLLTGAYRGALAAGVTVAIAVTIDHGRRAALLVPLIVALQWWPATCLGPLPFAVTAC